MKDEVLLGERDSWIVRECKVKIVDVARASSATDLKMKPTAGTRDWGVMSGALGGSDLRCVVQTSRSLELSHANIFRILTFLLYDLHKLRCLWADKKDNLPKCYSVRDHTPIRKFCSKTNAQQSAHPAATCSQSRLSNTTNSHPQTRHMLARTALNAEHAHTK